MRYSSILRTSQSQSHQRIFNGIITHIRQKEWPQVLDLIRRIPPAQMSARLYGNKLEALHGMRRFTHVSNLFDNLVHEGLDISAHDLGRCIESFSNVPNRGDRSIQAFQMLHSMPHSQVKSYHANRVISSLLKFRAEPAVPMPLQEQVPEQGSR